MRYNEFENIMSAHRMQRYLEACGQDTRKTMTLYRYNLLLSRELFTVVSCFEVALRNRVDQHYRAKFGDEWLNDAVDTNGMFMSHPCRNAASIIQNALRALGSDYTHSKLVAELGF